MPSLKANKFCQIKALFSSLRVQSGLHLFELAGTYFLPPDMFWDDAAVPLRLTSLAANQQLIVRLGMSFISTDQACSNAEAEIPDFDFDAVSQSSVSQFEGILNRIRVESTNVTDDVLSLFYSSVLLTFKFPLTF